MNCFICDRNEREVMLVKLPVETSYDIHHMQIVGNMQPGEFICLPCMGFQFDLLERSVESL